MAATSWNRAGNSARRAARAMVMVPVSSGSRSASSALRANSGNSSKNSTPLCAIEISPGRGGEPPPTRATALAEWWGLQVGRWPQRSKENRPLRLLMAALSSACSVLMSGSSPAKRCASMDLPAPGDPISKRLWPPAAAISRARLAPDWPLTSARSGPPDATTGALVCKRLQPSSASGGHSWGAPGKNWRTTSSRCAARYTREPGTSAASSALPGGSTKALRTPAECNAKPMAKAPRTGRSAPLKESSPANS